MQFDTDCAAQVIGGVEVVTAGRDMAQFAPMVQQGQPGQPDQQVHQRVAKAPYQWLADGGLPTQKNQIRCPPLSPTITPGWPTHVQCASTVPSR